MPTKVRCGGHVTLLFTVDKSTRLKRSQGSTGAGFSIQHGVQIEGTLHRRDDHAPPTSAGMTPAVHPKPPPPTESIVHVVDMDGEAVEDTTLYMDFIEACRHATLVRAHEWFELEIMLECPTSQGFGMSAAGLLASMQALATAESFGISAEKFTSVINGSTGRNNTTEVKMMPFIASRRYDSGFFLRLMAKDVTIASELMTNAGFDAPITPALNSYLAEALATLGHDADHTGLYEMVNPISKD